MRVSSRSISEIIRCRVTRV